MKKKVYLSGPIMDEHEGQARQWREAAKLVPTKSRRERFGLDMAVTPHCANVYVLRCSQFY